MHTNGKNRVFRECLNIFLIKPSLITLHACIILTFGSIQANAIDSFMEEEVVSATIQSLSPNESQQRTITGIVTDNNGNALPGVNVVAKGTMQGTITDLNGRYSLVIPSGAKILVYSFVGMDTQEIAVGESDQINVTLAG